MSPFLRLYFLGRLFGRRASVLGRLFVRLALVALAVAVAINAGGDLVGVACVAGAGVALVVVVGAFTAQWRNAGVRTSTEYRRLTRRWRRGDFR